MKSYRTKYDINEIKVILRLIPGTKLEGHMLFKLLKWLQLHI